MEEMKIDDVKAEKRKKAQEPAVHEKASENAKETVDAIMTKDVRKKYGDLEAAFAAIRGKQLLKGLEVLRAECAYLKEDNRQLKDGNVKTNNQLRVRDQEVIDLKDENKKLRNESVELRKTISKMQQTHEAEVQDLKDQIDEARAAAAVAEKAHARAVGEKNDYADALDSDSIAFEEILQLAVLMERSAKSMQEMSKMIQSKTEGRI